MPRCRAGESGAASPGGTTVSSGGAVMSAAATASADSYTATWLRPACFAAVQRLVGVLEQRVLVSAVVRIGSDAGRQRGQLLRSFVVDHRLAETVGSPQAGVRVTAHHDGELVAADPEDLLAGARPRLEHAGDGDEHPVAGRVALRVVDLLELVEVDEHERDRRLPRRRLLEDRLEVLVERAAVAEERQRVATRLCLALRELAPCWRGRPRRCLRVLPRGRSSSSNWTFAGITISSTPRRSPSASSGTAVAAPQGTPYVR